MKRILLMSALAAFVFGATAQKAMAGLYVEPYLGYEKGTLDTGGTSDDDITGTGFGVRLGYSMLSLAFGAEYGTLGGTQEDSSGTESDFDITDMGLFVSYEFPVMFRVFATYILDAKADDGGGEASGDGMKFGVGYTGFPFIVINLEKISRNYDTYDSNGGGSSAIDVKSDSLMLSVSLPLP